MPSELALLAHPLRSRLVAQLRVTGPATATTLARALGTNSGATSYHLRRLAEAGLVVDTEAGQGRERVWRSETTPRPWDHVSAGDADEDAQAALQWLERDYLRHFAEQADRWLVAAPDWPAPWRDAAEVTDATLLLTAEQLDTVRAEVAAVLARYRRVGAANPRARRVAAYLFCHPIDVDRVPQEAAE
jgi:DNA-binding transcriptional ArsR family regulator